MVQETLAMPQPSYFGLISGAIIIVVAIILIEIFLFKKKKYPLAIGGLIGFILAVANFFVLGMIGVIFWIPFASFCTGGEDCWLPMIIVGSIGLLLLGFLVGFIIEKIKPKKV